MLKESTEALMQVVDKRLTRFWNEPTMVKQRGGLYLAQAADLALSA